MSQKTSPTVYLCTLLLLCTCVHARAVEVELTRYLLEPSGLSKPQAVSFAAQVGSGRVVIEGSKSAVEVTLNGTVVEPDEDGRGGVDLQTNNQLLVVPKDNWHGVVRITQRVDVKLNVQSRVHFNTNVRDFEVARDFYGNLGFETVSGFPDANTVAMAEAIGIDTPTEYDGSQGGEAGGYLLHGELIGTGGFGGEVIDLIEFTIPRNEAPPYAALNHLGMARAVMLTSNLESDYERLSQAGVPFLSAPVARQDGTRFVVFTDPDGTFYELRQSGEEPEFNGKTHIHGLGALNVNVSDYARSVEWYRMFGYELVDTLPEQESEAVGRAYGFAQSIRVRGALMRHRVDGSLLEVVQWLSPRYTGVPYPLPINHIGIHRTALLTTDIEADVAALRAQGVAFVSPITPCCSGDDAWGSIVAFYDPDGVIVELVEQPFMSFVIKVMNWFR